MNFTVRASAERLTIEHLRRWRADLSARNMRGPDTLLLTREQFRDLERSLFREVHWHFSPVYEPGGRYGRIYGFEIDLPGELRTDDGLRGVRQAEQVFDAARMTRMLDPAFVAPRPRPRTLHSSWPA